MAPHFRRKNAVVQFNLMVVGFAGLGKTSFLRTFCDTLSVKKAEQRDVPQLQGPVEKTTKSYSMTFDIEEEGEKISLTIVDTPGFTDDFSLDKQLYSVLNYLEDQFDFTLAEESKVKRNPKALDNQIHACLYFIDPSRRSLNQSDIRILKKLTTRVNVIPVIAKADILTLAQREHLKKTILRDIFEANRIKIYGYPESEDEPLDDSRPQTASSFGRPGTGRTDGFNNGTLSVKSGNGPLSATSGNGSAEAGEEEDLGSEKDLSEKNGQGADESEEDEDEEDDEDPEVSIRKKLPFCLISFEDFENDVPLIVDTATGVQIRGRTFPWGTIDVLNPDHCDFSALRQVLLITHRKIFKDLTVEKYYEQYRTEKLLARKASRLLSGDVKKKVIDEIKNI